MGAYLSQPITDKNTKNGKGTGLSFVCCEMQGWRKSMEDAAIYESKLADGNSIFGVFDGHGGPQVSALVKQLFLQKLVSSEEYKRGKYSQALTLTFQKIDEFLQSKQGERRLNQIKYEKGNRITSQGHKISESTGCTANVVIITRTKYFIANAGDSRSVLFRNNSTIDLSIDHKPQVQQQLKRIRQAGGTVVMGRVNGGLNLTRAFGDFKYKKNQKMTYDRQMITCHPQIKTIQRSSQDQFILIGCDGIWENYVDNSTGLMNLISDMKKKNKHNDVIVLQKLMDNLLATETTTGLGCDNMTAILITIV